MAHSWSSRMVLVLAVLVGCGGGAKRSAPDAPAPDNPAPDCEPGRCLEDLAQRIDAHRAEARACYDASRERQPELEGWVAINYEIDENGTVIDASQGIQDDQITEPEVVDCLLEVIRGIQFAPSAKGRTTSAFRRFEFSR